MRILFEDMNREWAFNKAYALADIRINPVFIRVINNGLNDYMYRCSEGDTPIAGEVYRFDAGQQVRKIS